MKRSRLLLILSVLVLLVAVDFSKGCVAWDAVYLNAGTDAYSAWNVDFFSCTDYSVFNVSLSVVTPPMLVTFTCGSYGRQAECGAFGQTIPVYPKYDDQIVSDGNYSQTLENSSGGSTTWYPLTDTRTNYYVADEILASELGTRCWLDPAGNLTWYGPPPNVGQIDGFSALRWSTGYVWNWYILDQSDFSDTYANTSYTIKQVGSQLTGYATYLTDDTAPWGWDHEVFVTPPMVNNWLKGASDGYIGEGLINPLSILRYMRHLDATDICYSNSSNKGCRTGLPIKEVMHRNFARFIDVKDGHWVPILSYQVNKKADGSGVLLRHRMVDTDYKRKGSWVVEESYGDMDEEGRNTIIFYSRLDWELYRSWGGCYPPGFETNWGYSGIYAGTTDPGVTKIELLRGSKVIATSINEKIRNDETGQVVISGQMLAYTWLPQDTYRIRVTGSGDVKVFVYDKDGNPSGYTFAGSRNRYHTIPYCANADLGEASKVFYDLALGSSIRVYGGQVTGVVEGGFYIRPILSLVPSIFVKSDVVPISYTRISQVEGTVAEEAGQRFIDASYVQVQSYPYSYKPVGVVPERVSTTFHTLCRTVGRVTSVGTREFVLNNCLTVKSDALVSVSDLVVVEGVEHRGKFYANDVQASLQ